MALVRQVLNRPSQSQCRQRKAPDRQSKEQRHHWTSQQRGLEALDPDLPPARVDVQRVLWAVSIQEIAAPGLRIIRMIIIQPIR